ncbi:hypothetical protein DITRI_Ditri05aG0106900 [Diplodiscus trichospermus]
MEPSNFEGDKYRSHLHGEGEKKTKWRNGGPPIYDVVNKLFKEGVDPFLGKKALNMEGIQKLGGGYNPQLQTSFPEELRCYDPDKDT